MVTTKASATKTATKTTTELLQERRHEIEIRLKQLDESDRKAINAADKRNKERDELLTELWQIPGGQDGRKTTDSQLKVRVKAATDKGASLIKRSKSLSVGLLGTLIGIAVGIVIAAIIGAVLSSLGGALVAVWLLSIAAGAFLGFVIATRPKIVESTP